MAFWDLSDGGAVTDNDSKEFDAGGGNFDPIPDGSSVLAVADAAEWANTQTDKSGAEHVKITWSIVSPDEYQNRKIFHKLWVTDFDPGVNDQDKALKKRDKARKMLAAIDGKKGTAYCAQHAGYGDIAPEYLSAHVGARAPLMPRIIDAVRLRASVGEIADTLDTTAKAVEGLLARARVELAQMLPEGRRG